MTRLALLALALFALQDPPKTKQEKDLLEKRIEALFNDLVAGKGEPARSAARAELEALGKPALPVAKRFLDEELQRGKKAKEKAEATIARYVPRLDDDAVADRESAALALIALGEEVYPGLKKYETHPSAEVRARIKSIQQAIEARRTQPSGSTVMEEVVLLYSRLCDASGAALVAGFFEARSPELRLAALKAFHAAAPPSDLAKIKPLLADPDLRVRTQAVRTALDLGLDTAVPLLVDVVKLEADPNTWRTALYGAMAWRGIWPPEVTAKMVALMTAAPADRRIEIARAIFHSVPLVDPPETMAEAFRKLAPADRAQILGVWPHFRHENWLPFFKILSTDPDPATAQKAGLLYDQFVYGKLGGHKGVLERFSQLAPEERAVGLRSMVREETDGKPYNALPVIVREKDPALRKALIDSAFVSVKFITGTVVRDALATGQPDLVAAAADFTHGNSNYILWSPMRHAYAVAKDPALRTRLGFNLAVMGDAACAEYIPAFLKDPSPRMRARACDAVLACRAAEFQDSVAPLLKDPAIEVRRAAAEALLHFGDPKQLDALWALHAEDALVQVAIRAVGRLGRASDLAKLDALILQRPALKSYVARAFADFSPLEALPGLTKLAQDPDRQVQENARRALEHIKIAQTLTASLAQGTIPALDPRFPYENPFILLPAAECTPKVALEKHAIPLPRDEFLKLATVKRSELASIYGRMRPAACPQVFLDSLQKGHPRLDETLHFLRMHPYPEAAPKIAALMESGTVTSELMATISWCDPVLAEKTYLALLEKGSLAYPSNPLFYLEQFLSHEEYASLLQRLSKSPQAGAREATATAFARRSSAQLARLVEEGKLTDRIPVLRAAIRYPQPEALPIIEASLKDGDPAVRALAATALLVAKGREALPAALPCLKDALGEAAWELALQLAPLVAEEHASSLPADSSSLPVHAVLARLGRKESAARVLAAFPTTSPGRAAAAWALAGHLDAAMEVKLLEVLPTERDDEARMPICMALARSPNAATRTAAMTALRAIALYYVRGEIHPAYAAALEALIDKAEPGALERAAMYGSYAEPAIKRAAIGLVRKAATDDAAAALLQYLHTSIQDMPVMTPLVLEALKGLPKGPKAREKLKQLLAGGMPLDFTALAPLFAELGDTGILEEHLEKIVRTGRAGWAALEALARTPGGRERLRKAAADLSASKESYQAWFGGFALLLSGAPVPTGDWAGRYLQRPESPGTLLMGELRRPETVGQMLRWWKDHLSGFVDDGMTVALPLLTCSDLRLPDSESPAYWPALARFLHELDAWERKNRGRKFEEILADALKARGYAVAGKEVGKADAKVLVTALEDKDDFIAANAEWALRRFSGRDVQARLSLSPVVRNVLRPRA